MTDPVSTAFVLLLLLAVKHLIADFVLQSQYILEFRRFYGHPAGLLHTGIHLVGTLIALVIVGTPPMLIGQMLVVEGLVHYHVDWAKDNFVIKMGITQSDRGFWIALGADQMLHQLTYIGLAAWWLTAA